MLAKKAEREKGGNRGLEELLGRGKIIFIMS
jgi:hypothetical protein